MTDDATGERANTRELSEIELANVQGGGLISADFEGDVRVRAVEHRPAATLKLPANGTALR